MHAAAVDQAPRPARIEYIPGRVVCPLAGVGTRAPNASNRLVTDPDTEVTVAGGRITVRDDRPRAVKTPIADLVWLAEGTDTAGRRAPFTIHLELTKLGRAVSIELHTHEPRPLVRTDFVYEPLEVVVDDGERETVVDAARLSATVARITLARRAAAALMTTRDHRAGRVQDVAAAGYRVLDRSIGIGAFGRGAMLVRSQLISLTGSNAPLIAQGSLVEMLRHGSWELAIEAVTERMLPEIMARDLVLFGLDGVPLLRDVCAGKLRKGQVFAFRCTPDGGEVRLDDQRTPLPGALDVARAYLEFNMLGGMLAEAVSK